METTMSLESGMNELEILEFCVGTQHYGINVAKVKEILTYQSPTMVPNSHPCIEGIFMPRNEMITVVSLFKSLNIAGNNTGTDMLIVTKFNQLNIGFHVSTVLGIHRVSWNNIMKADVTLHAGGTGVATGVVKLGEKLIILLDFERIVAEISPSTCPRIETVRALGPRQRNEKPILIVEDSPMLEALIKDCLIEAGYTNITVATNGQEAWEFLQQAKGKNAIEKEAACVITDIEMPQMDGYCLTRLIKTDSVLRELPVIIFSSMVNEETKKRGKSLGANAQISKPEIARLVETMDRFLFE